MSQPTYVYEGIIERGSGTIRLAQLPADSAPVQFGVNGAITKHYGLDPMYIRFLGSLCVVLLLVCCCRRPGVL